MPKIKCDKLHVSDLKTLRMRDIVYRKSGSEFFLEPISLINNLHLAGADNLALELLEIVARTQDELIERRKKEKKTDC